MSVELGVESVGGASIARAGGAGRGECKRCLLPVVLGAGSVGSAGGARCGDCRCSIYRCSIYIIGVSGATMGGPVLSHDWL